MLLTLTTTHAPATDLGFLLGKHPGRFQSFAVGSGQAHVYYPEATPERCSACLLLEVDALALARGPASEHDLRLGQYVNDRPFVASSLLSVALAQVFNSALAGKCKDRPELATRPIPLEARLDVLAVRGGERALLRIFGPLGYEVEAVRHPLDPAFPEWGEGPYHTVFIRGTLPLRELLAHLYVLVPVFDARKHYYVGADEAAKLLAKGEGWLAGHPERAEIVRRYLGPRPGLLRSTLARLSANDPPRESAPATREPAKEKAVPLNARRLEAVHAALRACGARRVLDLGCGEGKLLRLLVRDRSFEQVTGVDVSTHALTVAARRLKIGAASGTPDGRVRLLHGSLLHRDRRLEGFDAAAAVEVVEHLEPAHLGMFARALFEFARPRVVVLTTPNREYNAVWEALPAGDRRHADHRFEWTRAEFREWAEGVAARFGYAVTFTPVGDEHTDFGPPTQMGVFTRS